MRLLLQNDPAGEANRLRLVVTALVIAQIGLHANMHGMRVAVPLRALSMGSTAAVVGVLVALFAIVPALFAISFGRFTDRVGYHTPVRFACVLSIIAGLSPAFSSSVAALCLGAACSGAGSGFGMIAVQRAASRMATSPAARLQIFSWVALAPAMAGLLGPTMAGLLIDHWGYSTAFGALGALPLLTLMATMVIPVDGAPNKAALKTERKNAFDLLKLAPLRHLLVVNWLVAVSWDAHGFVIPVLGHERGFSASAVGAIFASFGTASILVRVIMPFFSERLSPRKLLLGALALAGASLLVYPSMTASWGMAMCAFAFGLALGVVQPTILATLHDVAPAERIGEALALRSTLTQLSMSTMPIVFGLVGLATGASLLLWLMSLGLGIAYVSAAKLVPGPDDSHAS